MKFPDQETGRKVQQQINAALASARDPLTRDQVADIVRQVLGTIESDISSTDIKFYREIEGLARYIRNAKMEIAAIRPKDITTEHIPTATDQLDAVVGATEDATNKIMDECDRIGSIAGTLPPDQSAELTACVTRIFEACNFQDLTGQRITKVVGALKHIDEKIQALMTALGEDIGAHDAKGAAHHAGDPEKKLLNGPQMPGVGVSQDEIDKLFG